VSDHIIDPAAGASTRRHERGLSRRALLSLGGAGVLSVVAGAAWAANATDRPNRGRLPTGLVPRPGVRQLAFAVTDGWAAMPPASREVAPWWPDKWAPEGQNVYTFGFRDVTGMNRSQVEARQGQAQISAPLIESAVGEELWVTLSNLGLVMRPDLTDSHTFHWHGFRNAIPFYDGVPETSISVPIGRDFTYVFRPRDAGTYMYHCHFEDVEHVTMGMTGIVLVRPQGQPAQAYGAADGDVDGMSAFDREFTILLTEVDARAHWNDAHIQATDWTDFKPHFWLMNGRAYPDTLAPNAAVDGIGDLLPTAGNEHLVYQPQSSRLVAAPGERVLLRLANLGFEDHTLTMPGVDMVMVGADARFLGTARSVEVDTIQIGPGESRDIIIKAPLTEGTYALYNRDLAKYPGIATDQWVGGMRTELVVTSAAGPQQGPNHWDPSWIA
jgi:FtsP/CotA-like multicopper oxidase with cupredoxin domain